MVIRSQITDLNNAVTQLGYIAPTILNTSENPDCDGGPCTSLYFYHSDHLDSSTYLTDETGIPRQYLLYLPFREVALDQKAGEYDSRYKYTGKETDEDIGLNYHGARYYDPRLSMWHGVDPLAEREPEFSPYVYTFNNPIRYIDPDGRWPTPKVVEHKKMESNIKLETKLVMVTLLHFLEIQEVQLVHICIWKYPRGTYLKKKLRLIKHL